MHDLSLSFERTTIAVHGESTLQLRGRPDLLLVGPFRLDVSAWPVGKTTPIEVFVKELRIGNQAFVFEKWSKHIGNSRRGSYRDRFDHSVMAQLCCRNPYAVHLDVMATLTGHVPDSESELAELEAKLDETRRKLRKINAGLLTDAKGAERRLMEKARATAARVAQGEALAITGRDPAVSVEAANHEAQSHRMHRASCAVYDPVRDRPCNCDGHSDYQSHNGSSSRDTPAPRDEAEGRRVPPPQDTPAAPPCPSAEETLRKMAGDRLSVANYRAFDERLGRDLAALEAYNADVDGSLARQLEMLKPVDEAEDAAWESPTDEWP